jgi:hypothetical protein
MNKSSIFRSILGISTALFLLASCDKDFNEIGSTIIGDDHFDFLLDDMSTVVAFNQNTGIVQTNNMAINSLGVYDNPVFGTTKANFVTDLQLSTVNPTFDPEMYVSLDSVVLSIPYFSKKTATASDGKGTYKLDSIYGYGPINLKIFESGYVLNDLDPDGGFQNAQKYFSDADSDFNNNKKTLLYENPTFIPVNAEITTFKRDKGLRMEKVATNIEERLTPRIRIHLNKDFFENKILKAPAGKLVNNSVFKEYFRGLYFQVQDADTGTLMQLKFTEGDITLHYKEYTALEDADDNPATPKTPVKFPDTDPDYPGEVKKTAKTYVIKMAGNCVNLFQNTPSPSFANVLAATPNMVQGDEKLYLKGGSEGSMAVIDLFGPDADNNGVADELEAIRASKWLINEANLTFTIDKGAMDDTPEPQRVYLYDLKNKRPLIDYSSDATTISGSPKYNKYVHDGLLQKEEGANGKGIKYRVRITNHIRNLVRKDSTNVRLGLVVTESIENTANAWLKGAEVPNPARIFDRIPQASVMNPLGTILYGTNITAPMDYEKRLKLEIYYTKPN